MFRIDSEGSTLDKKFTEGDPSLGVAATVVSADWLNSVQEELSTVIEANGITLNKAQTGQLQSSLLEFFLRGGRAAPVNQPIANNQAATTVTGFTFDKNVVKARFCLYDIERKTSTLNKQETGIMLITRDTADNLWRVSRLALFDDDVGVDITPLQGDVGNIQYASDSLSGSSYVGTMKITAVIDIRV